MQRRLIFCNPDNCLGCLICEFVCSAVKERSANPSLSRIHVVNLEPRGSMAIACVLCEDTPCIRVCPRKALRQNNETGVVVVDEDRCNGCGWCIEGCPFEAITFNRYKNVVMICDFCGGDPECVKYCPFDGALTFSSIEEVAYGRRKDAFKKL